MVPPIDRSNTEPATLVVAVTAAILLGMAGLKTPPGSTSPSANAPGSAISGCPAVVSGCSARGSGSVRLMAGEPRTGLCMG